jgi:hypothetical protein
MQEFDSFPPTPGFYCPQPLSEIPGSAINSVPVKSWSAKSSDFRLQFFLKMRVNSFHENFSHSQFQMGFLPNSEWEYFSQMDQMGKHFQSRNACGIFSPYRKIILWDFFLPWDFLCDS